LPPSTYWRRRALVLLAVVAVAALLFQVGTRGGGEGRLTGPAERPSTATAPPTTPPTTTPPTAPPTAPATSAACPDGALTLVAATDVERYPLASTARLTLTLTNTSGAPCTRDTGQAALSFTVVSGSDRIWSSDDCSPGGAAAQELLAPAAPKVVTVPWSLARSAPGCPTDRPALQPGTYTVTARAGTLTSAPVVFRLVAS
jgi:hypothetical protein